MTVHTIKTYLGKRTIARDVTLGLALTIALVVISIEGLNYAFSTAQAEKELEGKATDMVEKLADILALPLWNIETDEIRQIARVYVERDDVIALRIWDEEEEVVYDNPTVEQDMITKKRDIIYADQQVGAVEVSLTRQSLREIKQNIGYTTLLVTFFVILAVVIVIRILLQRYLDLPLKRLTDGIGIIASGSYGHRLGWVKQVDVNEITQEVNVMAGAIQSREERLRKAKDELEVRVEERTTALREANQRLQVEVTERRWAEKEIRRLNETLQRRALALGAANLELESFSYSVSHDLRAPLRAIHGFAEMLADDYTEMLPPPAQEHLQVIQRSAQEMDQLIGDLLAFARLGRQALHRQEVDVTALVRHVIEAMPCENGQDRAEVIIGTLPVCQADPALLRQVLTNILSNAFKFARAQEGARIEVGSLEHEGKTAYFVKDNGVGFDMAYADKLFGVFQRLHLAEEYEGTGVGLALVQRIVRRHGGRVWAEGAVDEGATFYFTLE